MNLEITVVAEQDDLVARLNDVPSTGTGRINDRFHRCVLIHVVTGAAQDATLHRLLLVVEPLLHPGVHWSSPFSTSSAGPVGYDQSHLPLILDTTWPSFLSPSSEGY